MERPEFTINFRAITDNPELSQTDSVIFGFIYWFTRLKNEKCYASNETLADLARLPVSTVRNSLTKLEKHGFIQRVYSKSNPTEREEIFPLLGFSSILGAGLPAGGVLASEQGGAGKPALSIKKSIKEEHYITAVAEKNTTEEENTPRPTRELLKRSEKHLGRKWPNFGKQMKHIAAILDAGYTDADAWACFLRLEEDEYWGQKGYDWAVVASEIGKNKKITNKIKSYG